MFSRKEKILLFSNLFKATIYTRLWTHFLLKNAGNTVRQIGYTDFSDIEDHSEDDKGLNTFYNIFK